MAADLRLLWGRAGAGKTRRCLEEVLEELKRDPAGPPLLFIVPEQATFEVERALAAASPGGGFIRAYVLGFRRLAYRVLAETGGVIRPRISDLGKRLALRRLLLRGQDKLTLLGRAAGERHFADTLAGLINEFKAYGIQPGDLEDAAGKLPAEAGAGLGGKVRDLAFLYREYEEFLRERYLDPEDCLQLLAEKLPQAALAEGARVWVDGFTWFTPQEYRGLEALLQRAAEVTVTLCLDEPDSGEHSRPEALFYRQWLTRKKLQQLAGQLKASLREEGLPPGRRFAARPLLAHVEGNFFTSRAQCWTGDAQGLVVAEAANRRTEAEAIAREILRLSREEGLRWRDMAVLLRDSEAYGELMSGVLADHDIPVFSDSNRPGNCHPLAELLRSALEVLTSNWNYEAVFRCLKTDLCGLERDEVDILENYCLEFGIRGSRWTRSEPWTFRRRFSLDDTLEADPEADAALEKLDALRRRVVAPLQELASALRPEGVQAGTAVVYAGALYRFLLRLAVPERLEEWAVAREAAGELEQSREHRQMWREVLELLDQLVETFGGEALPLPEFAELIGEGLDGLKLSLIPPGLDYVTVGSLERSRLLKVAAVFIPGASDGCLPLRRRQEGLLSDADRDRLASCGLEMAGGAVDDTFAEQFLVYTALSRAGRQLWISSPLADADGKGLTPSALLKHLRELSGAPLKSLPQEPPPGRAAEYFGRPRTTLAVLNTALRQYRQGGQLDEEWWAVYNWAASRPEHKTDLQAALAGFFHHNQVAALPPGLPAALYCPQNRLRGSVTRFESFRACPFRHFAQYGLGLRERPVHRLADPDLGQFLHAVLKEFGERLQAEQRDWGSLSPEETAVCCGQVVNDLAPRLQNEILLSSRQYEHLLERLRRRAIRACGRLVEMAKVSEFRPLALELSFGRGDAALPPLRFGLGDHPELEVAGQIDRLDWAEKDGEKYIAVLDYKSGGAGLDMTEVYYGLRLQLLTYLLAVRGSGSYRPAALLYFFLKNPVITAGCWLPPEKILQRINGQLKLPGWVLAEPEVVRMLDQSMEGWSEFLKVGFTKDGFHKTCLPQLKTGEEFELLLAHTARELPAAAREILAGKIDIAPYCLEKRIPCGYCAYRSVCQFDRYLPENNYRFLRKLDGDTVLEELRRTKDHPGGEK